MSAGRPKVNERKNIHSAINGNSPFKGFGSNRRI